MVYEKNDPAISPTLRQLFIKQDRHRPISKKTKYLNAQWRITDDCSFKIRYAFADLFADEELLEIEKLLSRISPDVDVSFVDVRRGWRTRTSSRDNTAQLEGENA